MLNIDELSDGKFWKIEEIQSQLGQNLFTTNFEQDFNKFLYKGLPGLMQEIPQPVSDPRSQV